MIFRNESPGTGIGRVVAIITHHPVIVHLEGIFVCLFTIDVDTVLFYFQRIAFVCSDRTFVDRQIILGQFDGSPLLRYPDWTVVIAIPLV